MKAKKIDAYKANARDNAGKEALDKADNMWGVGEIALISPDDTTGHEIYIIKE